ncbi:SpoIIE family protein phosphatase [Lipingzhangella sp. LS1_29]|uniref:SpoIIE family protein phosphatase n=1 Tax=Lipingzhangella rawalii TaxID=2055835 RepID=A0ABU2H9F4_9ACTN|nr:SpoIIE family protein phosphatase [Lipingzhangella rawalii]MDS1271946.1 SpoIIE family protein phosphatase [Lipingzhangella rawalii]
MPVDQLRGQNSDDPEAPETVELLLIEDDSQDAFLVEEYLAETSLNARITWVATLHEARPYLASFQGCVLLDLNLPDAHGIELLREVLSEAQHAAVVVFTGLDDEHEGVAAVAAGAQDYLVKGHVDGALLARSLRYSLERRHAEESARQLREAEFHARENLRLERGLLPQLLLAESPLVHRSLYRPGRKRTLLGGDFFDAVHQDGVTHVIVGDVSGHGPDEAALGVSLRIAWRALVVAGVPENQVLHALERVLVSERAQEENYATLCQVSIDDGSEVLRVRLLGHPPPLAVAAVGTSTASAVPSRSDHLRPEDIREVSASPRPPLGIFPGTEIEVEEHPFPSGSMLLMYTDGVIDAYDTSAEARLGVEGLQTLLAERMTAGTPGDRLLKQLVDEAERRNGDSLQDDVAMLLLTHGSRT